MNKLAAFLTHIREQPDEDAPRLVLADWLDDHHRPEWAEFIRCQVELARLDPVASNAAELLARAIRSGVYTAPRQEPFFDHVPGAKVSFRRGLIHGIEARTEDYLALPSEQLL
jgi:uncharacterized protein (TIGR02996 family)